MKAIVQDRYGSADVLELRDIDPPVAGEHDVVVRVHAAGCGPDVWHVMTGLPYFARLRLGFDVPSCPSAAGMLLGPSKRSVALCRAWHRATRSWAWPTALSPSWRWLRRQAGCEACPTHLRASGGHARVRPHRAPGAPRRR